MNLLKLLPILLLTGCATTYGGKVLGPEEQSIMMARCNNVNLDYQVKYNNAHEVIGISCVPRYGYIYETPKSYVEPTLKKSQ